ncbi:MAG TPA: HDOD domain-containing protein [Desulfuromonadales bacterium]|nr:HDOD domain-containing protein [Desulfuromonadales bacterium]
MNVNFNHQNAEMLSRSLDGSLSLMPLSDIFQWVEVSRRSGTLIVNNDESIKRFYFEHGALVFVWSECEGERLCEELAEEFNIPEGRILEHLNVAEQLGISCLGYIASQEGVSQESLNDMITSLVKKILSNTVIWKVGHFRFCDFLPPSMHSSPVTLTTSHLLLDSIILADEEHLDDNAGVDRVLDEIFEQIRKGTMDIPPIPADMGKLMALINKLDPNLDDIIAVITDPLLVIKIFRVCNSPYMGHHGKINTLREAVIYMGMKSVLSIVTVHALSGFSPANADRVHQVLHHSLMVGMIAKQISKDMHEDREQAFVCGLLHDLGWIVMIEILSNYDIPADKQRDMIRDHHATIGYLVAKKWNFSEEIQDVIRYHHDPGQECGAANMVRIIHMSDMLARNEVPLDEEEIPFKTNSTANPVFPFSDSLEELSQEIESILAPL